MARTDTPEKTPLSLPVTIICLVFALAPAIALAVMWGSLPEVIPAHWGEAGIDRWGTKMEMVVVPVVGFILSGLLLFGARRAHADDYVSFLSGELSERNVMVVSSIATSLIALGGIIAWIAGALDPTAVANPGDPAALSWQVLGVPAIFLVAGLLMAMRSLNMPENDEVLGEQYHAQRIAGASMVIAGVLMGVLSALILPGTMTQVGQAVIAAIDMAFVFILLRPWL